MIPHVVISARGEERLRGGHPWIYRADVAEAYAKTHARFAQITTNEAAVRSGLEGFQQDFDRIKSRAVRTVLPIS